MAPLACKTDRVYTRVLADLACRDLVLPSAWVPPLHDRAMRERLRRSLAPVPVADLGINRGFGLRTQWGLKRT